MNERYGLTDTATGWMNMLCIEAGSVKGFQKLEAGETFEGGQIIKASL